MRFVVRPYANPHGAEGANPLPAPMLSELFSRAFESVMDASLGPRAN